MKQILANYPRLQNFYDLGPVQKAELESFICDFVSLGSAVTADHKLVNAGDQVYVVGSTGNIEQCRVLPLQHNTSYNLFGPVSVSSSFATLKAAEQYVKDAYET